MERDAFTQHLYFNISYYCLILQASKLVTEMTRSVLQPTTKATTRYKVEMLTTPCKCPPDLLFLFLVNSSYSTVLKQIFVITRLV